MDVRGSSFRFIIQFADATSDNVREIRELYSKIEKLLKRRGIKSHLIRRGHRYAIYVNKLTKAKPVITSFFPECMLYWKNPFTATTPEEFER